MTEKKVFELPVITTYRRDELIVETVFTGGTSLIPSDRRQKVGFRAVSGQEVLRHLLRVL